MLKQISVATFSLFCTLGLTVATAQPAAAQEMLDQFSYPPFKPVPSPWYYSTNGGSSNQIVWGLEVLSYSGTGWGLLSRYDLVGTNAKYQIDFYDDGTQNLGELFYLDAPNGGFIGIGVNNSVQNGYYYVRTDQNSSNGGPRIRAPRNGRAANGNWHTLSLYVTPGGSWPTVDDIGIPGFEYGGVTSVSAINIRSDWNKPAHNVLVDNFRVDPLDYSHLFPGTHLNSNGQIDNPYGSSQYNWIGADQLRFLYEPNFWTNANAKRADIVKYALAQLSWTNNNTILSNDGTVCDDAAASYYDGGSEWCSEFVRDMYDWRNDVSPGKCFCEHDSPLGCYDSDCVRDITESEDLENIFQAFNGWVSHDAITPWTPLPGDYLMVPGEASPHHSALIVGVSADGSQLFTIEGNFHRGPNTPACVRFNTRTFFKDGVLDPNITAIGRVNTLF